MFYHTSVKRAGTLGKPSGLAMEQGVCLCVTHDDSQANSST